MLRRTPKERTVHRSPVRYTQSQLDRASRLMASTGITNLSQLVHVALAQLEKTTLGAPLDASQTTHVAKPPASDRELNLDF